MRGGDIDVAGEIFVIDDPANRRREVAVVNPRHVLPPVPSPPTQPVAHEIEQHIERAAGLRTHDDRGTELHLARERKVDGIDRALPCSSDLDAEAPCLRNIGLIATEDSILIVRGIVAVRIDRGGAGLQPESRRTRGAGDRFADDSGGVHTRIEDLVAIPAVVAAIDAAASQINDHVCAIDLPGPIPPQPPASAEDHDLMVVTLKVTAEDGAEMS